MELGDVDRDGVQVNMAADDGGNPVPIPEVPNGDGLGVVPRALETDDVWDRNEVKPLKALRTAEQGIPDEDITTNDVFPGWPRHWVSAREWRLPKEESPPERLLEYFEDVTVLLSYVKDPSHFYVIRASEFNECQEFNRNLGSVMWAGSENYKPGSQSNLAVLRGHNGNVWKRFEILEYLPNQFAYIRFMDEGRTTTLNIPSRDVMKMHESFKDEPGYAILCSLYVEPIGGTWPEMALEALNRFVGKVIKVRCIKQTRGFHVTHIVKIFLPGADAEYGSMLIERGMGKKRTDIPGLE